MTIIFFYLSNGTAQLYCGVDLLRSITNNMLLARDGGHKLEDQQPHVADDHHVDPAAIVDDLLGLTQVDC